MKHGTEYSKVDDKQSEPLHKRRRNAFGRPDLAETYRKAKDLIIENKVFRLCQFVEFDGIKQLTICNLWRIERMPDGSIKTLEFRLNQGQWKEVTSLEYWPEVPFYPIKKTQSLNWWRSVAKRAIWKALVAAGYHNLPRFLTPITNWSLSGDRYIPQEGKPEMSPKRMAYLLIRRYIGSQGKWNEKKKTHDWKAGFLTQDSMMSGARALRAAFYQHILDTDVLSAALTIDYRNVSFIEYLRYAQHREGLLKVSAEHRNLLPILPGINRDQWGRDDLFSRKLWVKDGRKTTALDRRAFRVESPGRRVNYHYKSFDAPAAWRWLSKASSIIIKEWVNDGFGNKRDPGIITNLAFANVCVRAPVIAYVHIMRSSGRLKRYGVSPRIQQLLRLFLMHSARLWKDKGFAEIKMWLRGNGSANISVMLDYLDAEGFGCGQPDRNATWASLVRRSDDWHKRIAIESVERKLGGQKLLEWVSLVPETIIDDIVFMPLSNSRELAVEGYEMHHCIGQYAGRCHRGKYRAYSVKEPNNSRSTLGFEIIGKEVHWEHMSKYNRSISHTAHEAGKKLIALYQQALENVKIELTI